MDFEKYLVASEFMDYNHPAVQSFVNKNKGKENDVTKQVIHLYYAVRDGFRYDPYNVVLKPEALKASALIARGSGFCIEKANLLAACARSLGVPSRLGFANVKNHIATGKIEATLHTDLLVFHGYADLFLNGKWVKATPAFNKSLCEKFQVEPLDFDGRHDSLFQQFDKKGNKYMEYVHQYGHYPEIPLQLMINEFKRYYPHLFDEHSKESSAMRFVL